DGLRVGGFGDPLCVVGLGVVTCVDGCGDGLRIDGFGDITRSGLPLCSVDGGSGEMTLFIFT
ncbi:unnamed protein product, partial [Rotaria sp. Silwood1]